MIAFLFLALTPVPVTPQCPNEIKTEQSALNMPVGWSSSIDSVNAREYLEGVSFYSGPPAQMADLVPDDENAKQPSLWTFAPGEKIWMVCRYANTKVRLARELPKDTKQCRVSWGKKSEDPLISTIVCK